MHAIRTPCAAHQPDRVPLVDSVARVDLQRVQMPAETAQSSSCCPSRWWWQEAPLTHTRGLTEE